MYLLSQMFCFYDQASVENNQIGIYQYVHYLLETSFMKDCIHDNWTLWYHLIGPEYTISPWIYAYLEPKPRALSQDC